MTTALETIAAAVAKATQNQQAAQSKPDKAKPDKAKPKARKPA